VRATAVLGGSSSVGGSGKSESESEADEACGEEEEENELRGVNFGVGDCGCC
jgi:hypothetical protein